jgi:hypothetical protein
MFHNYQTKEDIQAIIIDALVSMDRPSLMVEVSSWAWHRTLIDGTADTVRQTIKVEMAHMQNVGVLDTVFRRGAGYGIYFVIQCPLSAIAIKQVQQNSQA